MFDIYDLLSRYELLELTAQYLSTMDLYHTALTCSDLFALIMKPSKKFERLRQKYEGIFNMRFRMTGPPVYDKR